MAQAEEGSESDVPIHDSVAKQLTEAADRRRARRRAMVKVKRSGGNVWKRMS